MIQANNKLGLYLHTHAQPPSHLRCTHLSVLLSQRRKTTLSELGLVKHVVNAHLLTLLSLQTKSYIRPTHPYASPLICVSFFPIHHKVITLSENVPKLLTSSENHLFKQRREKKGLQYGIDFKQFHCILKLTKSPNIAI